jgi:hypothetical protein
MEYIKIQQFFPLTAATCDNMDGNLHLDLRFRADVVDLL